MNTLMTFTTPCFVRVENQEKRKELIEWLGTIGRPHIKVVPLDVFPYFVAYNAWHDNVSEKSLALYRKEMAELIDCGENTEMFKALAAMNDENDYLQWFYDDIAKEFCFNHGIKDEPSYYHGCGTRKATAAEIVEHFKKNER